MEIKYKDKPTVEVISKYCKKIEYFLSEIGVKIRIEVYDIGALSTSSIDGVLVSQEKWWLGDFIVSAPQGEFKLKAMPRFGIDDSISDNEIWHDAVVIQEQVYKQFGLVFDPRNEHDPFWSLWKKISQ
jgi:hypothetical protein